MAGRRRGTGRPTQTEQRWSRRRAFLAERLARAGTPGARVGAAAEYMRAALGDVAPDRAERAATEVVRVLTDVVDRLQAEEARR